MDTVKLKEGGYEGFVSSSKGITLSIVSVCVWGFTFVFYKMAAAINKDVDYAVFCLFCSFILSLILGILITKNIYDKKDSLRILAILLNIFLIYTSANGIQAGNSAFSKPERGNNEKSITKSALFGIFDSRPWLPDATSNKKIRDLTDQNNYLTRTVEDYKEALNAKDQTELITILNGQNERMKTTVDSLMKIIVTIREKEPAPGNEDQLRAEINILRNYINDRVYPFINLKNEWVSRVNSDKEFAYFANQIRNRLGAYKFSDGYYDKFFYYDLTPPK